MGASCAALTLRGFRVWARLDAGPGCWLYTYLRIVHVHVFTLGRVVGCTRIYAFARVRERWRGVETPGNVSDWLGRPRGSCLEGGRGGGWRFRGLVVCRVSWVTALLDHLGCSRASCRRCRLCAAVSSGLQVVPSRVGTGHHDALRCIMHYDIMLSGAVLLGTRLCDGPGEGFPLVIL